MKSQVRSWLACADFERVTGSALEHVRTIAVLIALTYDSDLLICWRAIDAIGRCAERLSGIRPESMKNYLRRLFWMMSDESGTVAWHAPEAIGEIIRSDPREFCDFIPLTISFLNMEPEDRPFFLPGILYAIGRIGEVVPQAMTACLPQIEKELTNEDAQIRAMAVLCLGRMRAGNLLFHRRRLSDDQEKALVYREKQLVETTVGFLLTDVLDSLSKTPPSVRPGPVNRR